MWVEGGGVGFWDEGARQCGLRGCGLRGEGARQCGLRG